MGRREYSEEFRINEVKQVIENRYRIVEMAKKLEGRYIMILREIG